MPEVADAPVTTTPAPETSSAPVTSTSSTPATSTTQTTASTPAVAERPSDWRSLSKLMQGLDAKDAAAPDPKTTTTPVGATTQPVVDPTKPGEVPSTPQGPIPFEVHSKALENARAKVANDVRAQYGNVAPEKLQEFAGIARQMTADPIGFLNTFASQLANHPIYGPQLRSSAGRTLAAPAPHGPPGPDIEVIDGTGKVVSMTFSPQRQAEREDWLKAQVKGEFQQMIQPFQQERDQRIQQEQVKAAQAEVNATADQSFKRIDRILDGRKDLHKEVANMMAIDPQIDPYDAALEVRSKFIVPNAEAAAQAAALESNRKKANGNTASGTGAIAKRTLGPNATQKEIATWLREQDGVS